MKKTVTISIITLVMLLSVSCGEKNPDQSVFGIDEYCSLGYEYGVNLQHEHAENSPNEEMIVTIPEKINGNTVRELNSTFYASGAVKISLPNSI